MREVDAAVNGLDPVNAHSLLELSLYLANMLLRDTDQPLKEIASLMGFNDPGSFSTAFRRATGDAPRTFRQQFAKGGFVARAALKASLN